MRNEVYNKNRTGVEIYYYNDMNDRYQGWNEVIVIHNNKPSKYIKVYSLTSFVLYCLMLLGNISFNIYY